MQKLSIRGKDLRLIGFPEGPVMSLAITTMQQHYKYYSVQQALSMLQEVLKNPTDFLQHQHLGKIAKGLLPNDTAALHPCIKLTSQTVPISIYGQQYIEQGALQQMHTAARLPVAVAGALMPDAHTGYGLPIGGVLATSNSVIPFGVGVDIGCRMCLSVFEMPPTLLKNRQEWFTQILLQSTLFGAGQEWKQAPEHEIMDDPHFNALPLLKQLKAKAARQLGTSGSGNHFAEFGTVSITNGHALGIAPGNYLGLLTHSGSRALGANIANYYTQVARQLRKLPQEAAHLAWLQLNEPHGQEYWMAMNLAGRYASACHQIIHQKMAKHLSLKPVAVVENHHNFAWKENYQGQEVIVHRKGATPAANGVLGIIPGSMTAPGYIVMGKGVQQALFSASHGAGRLMSRSKALQSITRHALQKELDKYGVTLIGGGLDEAPFVYKDITAIMQAQHNLVDTVGTFSPKLVRMDGTPAKVWNKKMAISDGE